MKSPTTRAVLPREVPDVHLRRPYLSSLPDRQATATRHAVLEVARELLLAHDYATTTVNQIGLHAGMSKPTIFSAVGNEQTLLGSLPRLVHPRGERNRDTKGGLLYQSRSS